MNAFTLAYFNISLILRVARGCSHNLCTFCTMYKDRPFEVRSISEIQSEIRQLSANGYSPQRIFLADGNALCLKTEAIIDLLKLIKSEFPDCQRISSYAAPQDVIRKSPAELNALRLNGLQMVYMGLESGSARLLKDIQKGVTPIEMIDAGQRIKAAGMILSLTVISGLGGRAFWQEHALETAVVVNHIQPHFLGLLTLMLEPDCALYEAWQRGEFTALSSIEVLQETHLLLENLELVNCVMRSNHASNYFSLKGQLPEDKPRLMSEILAALNEGPTVFRHEMLRGL